MTWPGRRPSQQCAPAGTLLVEQGVHIRVVQEILGHARVTTTERYTHVAGALIQDASERTEAGVCSPIPE
ncbi:tyrosine-type recombinase/integrase [Microtetraspora sp. NBRC 16547]|uniref:tyrosine-type recombinase/integrase n=1 Tax=Microtetraspora sp. NBRC 16547 TaxID=3030993 RepID=UPI002553DEDA|nr:tyrosine-type recombinase/integrase [Microtetraspora sp. NBRC 16547]